jgi:hypothetical protein
MLIQIRLSRLFYVDALNIALTGDLFALSAICTPGCGCLEIADRLAEIFPSSNLNWRALSIKTDPLISDAGFTKEFEVLVYIAVILKRLINNQGEVWFGVNRNLHHFHYQIQQRK